MQSNQDIALRDHTHVGVAILIESIGDIQSDTEGIVYVDETDTKTGEVVRVPVIL